MKERLYILDWIRVLAILYIVFVWHIDDYASNVFYNNFTYILTYVCLHAFVFISSYLLAKTYTISKPKEIIAFIKKRVIRVYPLYLLALVLYILTSQISLKQFLAGIFMLNMVFDTHLLTLWFISMISIFYLLLSIILYNYSLLKAVCISFAFCLFIIIMHKLFGLMSLKLLYFYPLFFMGIFCAKHLKINLKWGRSKIVTVLSYSTFCMYIFHRIIYWELLKIYRPHTNATTIIYLAITGIPAIYFISKGIQTGYDKIVAFSSQAL